MTSKSGSSRGLAFAKGGVGCIVAFFVIGAIVLLIGGTVYFDAPGLILLFIIGGLIGLVVSWVYQRGRRDAQHATTTEDRGSADGAPQHGDESS